MIERTEQNDGKAVGYGDYESGHNGSGKNGIKKGTAIAESQGEGTCDCGWNGILG